MSNPYIIDRPLTARDLFFGREGELRRLAKQLNSGRHLVLVFGRPSVGKTSFLNQLPPRLATHYRAQVIDLNPILQDSAEPLWAILLGVAQALGLTAPSPDAFREGPEEYTVSYLRVPLAGKGAEDQVHGTPAVVCLDGLTVHALARAPWREALRKLPALLEMAGLRLVVAVQGHPAELAPDSLSDHVAAITLGPLQPEETEDLIMSPVRGVLAHDYEAVQRIHRLCGGHPYYAQLYGYTIFEERAAAGWARSVDIEAACERVVERGAPLFERTYEGCAPLERIALAAFAELKGGGGLCSAGELRAHLGRLGVDIPTADLESALASLCGHGLLERLGGETYRFAIDLFRLWLRSQRPTVDAVNDARRLRQVRLRRTSGHAKRPVDWLGVTLWVVAGALAVAIAASWRSRQRAIVWTAEPAPVPTQAAFSHPPTPTVIPPTPDTGVALGNIVFMAREGDESNWSIYSMRSDGSDPTRLSKGESNDTSPSLSPDGRRIVFVSDRDRNREIYAMNSDGGAPANLTLHPSEDWTPCWSPDGQRVAYSSFRDGNWEIYVMNADGSKPVRLTQHPAMDYSPAWSPDGRSIAFVSSRDGNLEIYVMDADGRNARRLTSDPATDQAPCWSPDGTQIIWASYRTGNMELFMANSDGSNATNVTKDSAADDHGPSWAPRGRRIAFYSNRDGGWDIYTLDLDSGQRVNLTQSALQEQAPHWGR